MANQEGRGVGHYAVIIKDEQADLGVHRANGGTRGIWIVHRFQ